MDGWSSNISGDKQQGYEVNQAKGLAVANGAYVSVSLQEPIRVYVPCYLPQSDWLLRWVYSQMTVGGGAQASFPCI